MAKNQGPWWGVTVVAGVFGLATLIFRHHFPEPPLHAPGVGPTKPPVTTPPPPPAPAMPLVMLVDSSTRDEILRRMYQEARTQGQGRFDVDARPNMGVEQWPANAADIGNKHPKVVVLHLHALRSAVRAEIAASTPAEQDARAAEELVIGMASIVRASPKTKYIVYSSSFSSNGPAMKNESFRKAVVGARQRGIDQARLSTIQANTLAYVLPNSPSRDALRGLSDFLQSVVATP